MANRTKKNPNDRAQLLREQRKQWSRGETKTTTTTRWAESRESIRADLRAHGLM